MKGVILHKRRTLFGSLNLALLGWLCHLLVATLDEVRGNGSMLAFKILFTPLLTGLIGLADRRWGASVGGWLVGLPLTTAPIALFVAIEEGRPFAASMATGVLMGLASQSLFCLVYAWLSFRVNWLGSWLLGWGAFGLSVVVLDHVSLSLPLTLIGLVVWVFLVLLLWPQSFGEEGPPRVSPAWAIPGRMVVATSIVLILTATANLLGPRLSGLLSVLPILTTVFTVFAHKLQGGRPARQVLHGVVVSSFACAAFFVLVGEFVERWSLVATFGGATVLTLLTQGVVLWVVRGRTRRKAIAS